MTRGRCPEERPKWYRCPTCFRGTMYYVRLYAGSEVWRCRSCNATKHKLPGPDHVIRRRHSKRRHSTWA